jgi:hypothetical protein
MTKRNAATIRRDLEDLGVGGDASAPLARRLARAARDLDEHAYQSLLAGVALAHGEHRRGLDALRSTARDLEEIQHLLSGFSEELRKLDEAVETLGAYALRMRSQSSTRDRLLH